MPGAMPYNVSRVVQLVRTMIPRSVLDIGAGFGAYGVLFREHLDILRGRYHKRDWKIQIDAVEVFSPYLNPIHEYVYDNVYHCDIRDFDWDKEYDLVFMGDVIEHFSKEEAIELLGNIKCDKIILSTPDHGVEESNVYMGNQNEEHKHIWSEEEFWDLDVRDCKGVWKDEYMITVLLGAKKEA